MGRASASGKCRTLLMWFDVLPLWPLLALATLGLGAPVRAVLLRGARLSRPERLAWDFLLGTGLSGYAIMGLGFAGALTTSTGWTLAVVGVWLGGLELRAVGFSRRTRKPWDIRVLLGLTALAVLWQLWGCLTPEFGGDALNYHLGAPRDWIDAGRIVNTPLRFTSAITGHHLMIYTWCLLIGGDVLCKLMQTTQLIAALVLAHSLARHVSGSARVASLATCLLILCLTAAWMRVPTMARSDVMALLFATGALGALVRVVVSSERKRLPALGVCVGLAAATKYSTLPFLAVPAACALVGGKLRTGEALRPTLKTLGIFCGMAALSLSPWMLREWATTGDPLYPLLSDILPIEPDYAAARKRVDAYQATFPLPEGATPLHTLAESWKRKALHAAAEGDFLLLFMPLLALGALCARRPRIFALGVFGTVATLLLASLALAELGRFFLVTAPVSAALAALGLDNLSRRTRLRGPLNVAAAGVALIVLLRCQIMWLGYDHMRWDLRPVMTQDAAMRFIQTHTPEFQHVIPAYEWIDANLPKDATVLCVNHFHAYHLPRRHWTSGRWNMEVYDFLLAETDTPLNVTEVLRTIGITHLLRQGDNFEVDPTYWPWEAETTDLLWHEGDVWVFSLR